MNHVRLLTDAQLRVQLERCEFCETRPCREACPAHCSPADFIMAARPGGRADVGRAAAEIMMANPFGGVCGMVCPDKHCKAACSRAGLDGPVEIPSVQATLVQKAKALGKMPVADLEPSREQRVAVVGAGPAGLAAAAVLGVLGYGVDVFDEREVGGGTCNLIPPHRLPREILQSDVDWLLGLSGATLHANSRIADPLAVLEGGYDAVVVAVGLTKPFRLDVKGAKRALDGLAYLAAPHRLDGHVVVVGGGATAVDVAVTARLQGAEQVELICLERWDEMPLEPAERAELAKHGILVTGRTRVSRIRRGRKKETRLASIETCRVTLPTGEPFSVAAIADVPGTEQQRPDVDHVILAIGARPSIDQVDHPMVIYAGDCRNGPTTVVTASASGKNAALEVDALLRGDEPPVFAFHGKSRQPVPGRRRLPVPLDTDFFGRRIRSPFLLSAAPPSDGYEQMRRAYEAGWAGGVMKTAFDGVEIHIPGEYMHVFDTETWGNSDNVSGHSLDRVCAEIARLVKEWPDRLTIGSTGGPVTGHDDLDARVWVSNTRKLERAGAMAIEYSLSCPQGGDGTEGDIVSQSPALTAKIVEWVLSGARRTSVPKLFKLTAAVTSVEPILEAIATVAARYPRQKVGVTLANTFPTLNFRERPEARWDQGIVVGMSGSGIAPISYFTLARAGALGIPISGNGGAMDHKMAAHFLALGCGTVQFCTLVMKQGYGVIDHLETGLGALLAERGLASVAELVGRAQPNPVTDFMALSPSKKVSRVDEALCLRCGNCTRCPYLAITLDARGLPVTDPSLCIGCSICAQKCFAGALSMHDRTPAEQAALVEA